MNKSKKIIKEQGLQTPDKKEVKEKAKSRKNLILILIGIIVILGGVFVVCYTQLRPREILSVEGPAANSVTTTDTLYYSDAMYDIYQIESMYNAYGMDWDQENGGSTLSESVKNQIMESLKKREVLCMQAEKDNITLTDEEKKEIDTSVEEALKSIDESENEVKGVNESNIRESLEKQKIAEKEKDHIIEGFDIDEEAIKKDIKKEDFRQYTLQYYTISKKTEPTDENEEAKDKDAATLAKDKENMDQLLNKARTAEDFSKLLTDSDSDNKDDDTGIQFGEEKLVETDESFADEKVRKQIKMMGNDQISNVLETDDAYYIFKMVNNNDPEAYENEVKSKIESEQNTKFNEYYDNTLKKQYTFQVSSYWKERVQIGNVTIA